MIVHRNLLNFIEISFSKFNTIFCCENTQEFGRGSHRHRGGPPAIFLIWNETNDGEQRVPRGCSTTRRTRPTLLLSVAIESGTRGWVTPVDDSARIDSVSESKPLSPPDFVPALFLKPRPPLFSFLRSTSRLLHAQFSLFRVCGWS